jgi:hypothetical protein
MRFFACDARVVENCLVAFLAGDARSILDAKEMDFMVGDRVIAGYGEVSNIGTMYTSKRVVSTSVCNSCRNQDHQCVWSQGAMT